MAPGASSSVTVTLVVYSFAGRYAAGTYAKHTVT